MEASPPSPGLPVHSLSGVAVSPAPLVRPNGGAAQLSSSGELRAASGSASSSQSGNSATPPQSSASHRPGPLRNGHAGHHGESQRQYEAGAPPGGRAPSPTLGGSTATGHSENPNYVELTRLMKHASPQLLRQAIRDNWGLCLSGSEYHTAFILNAMLHQATPPTLSRAAQDFGQKMVQTSKHQLLQHFTSQDFDEVADLILSKCGNKFLDQALARRLETVPARQLVNALARAERLGYDIEDIVEDKHDSQPEHVYPSGHAPRQAPVAGPSPFRGTASPVPVPVPPQAPAPAPAPAPHTMPPQGRTSHSPQTTWPAGNTPSGTNPQGIEFCDQCGRPCSGPESLRYHQMRKACNARTADMSRFDRDICPHCGTLFGSGGGLYYHKKSNVCGKYDEQRLRDVMDILTRTPGQPPQPVMPALVVKQFKASTLTPSKPAAPSHVTPTGTPSSSDPYASLTPEQRANFNKEMKAVEEYYGGLMRDVVQNLPESEQEEELGKIKNRFNTKQSMTRKKYGIRLRGRRSRAQMEEADRNLGIATPTPSLSSHKRPRMDHENTSATSHRPPMSQTAQAAQRVPLSERGGLANQSATAEHVDPTAFLTPSQPRHVPLGQPTQKVPAGATSGNSSGLSAADPMQIDDDDENEDDDGKSGSDSESDGGDIPAKIPNGQDLAPVAHIS